MFFADVIVAPSIEGQIQKVLGNSCMLRSEPNGLAALDPSSIMKCMHQSESSQLQCMYVNIIHTHDAGAYTNLTLKLDYFTPT